MKLRWLPVSLAAAHNWLHGDATDGQLILCPVDTPAAVLILEMHGHVSGWRLLMDTPEPWHAAAVVFRTSRPGLHRLGVVRGLEEPDGRTRCLLEGATVAALRSRIFRHRQGTAAGGLEAAG